MFPTTIKKVFKTSFVVNIKINNELSKKEINKID